MESGTFVKKFSGDPRAGSADQLMLRAQAVLSAIFFSILALALEPCATAQASPPTAVTSAGAGSEVAREVPNDISNKQPTPRSFSAVVLRRVSASSQVDVKAEVAEELERFNTCLLYTSRCV